MADFSLDHDGASVRALHQAYADKTQSFFLGLQQIPGNPYQVRIRNFGATRTAMAQGYDWFNRVTLIGDESLDLLDEILAYFEAHRQRCHIEWNPAICYRPDSWNVELEPFLRTRGFHPAGFRCVWHGTAENNQYSIPEGLTIRHFAPEELTEFIDIVMALEDRDPAQRREIEHNHLFGEGSPEWHHYICSLDGTACSTATLFAEGGFGYLAWSHTLPQFRRRGCQSALIRRRIQDAHAAGCRKVFTVTDFSTSSAANLQRAGFRLAYNSVMLIRELPFP
jgi:GNAT superfamily N-acetyltransferase